MLQLIVAGNVGKDAVVRLSERGDKCISFSVAHTVKWKDAQGNNQQRTTWIECSWWKKADQSTEVHKFIKQGISVTVIGEPSARGWQGTNGEVNGSLCLKVLDLQLGGVTPGSNGDGGRAPQASTSAPAASTDTSDDLPF